jgi:hypothetical protein
MRLIRDAIIAIAVACVLVGSWELVGWLASIGTSAPDAQPATGLVEPTPQRPDP